MIGRTNAGGSGGGGLNLKVVGGTTKPANPRENTIWVNTTTAITGYVLSPTQPETGTEGLVWLKTAETGVEINVGRKNAVLLHLAGGTLYTGSAWKNVECSAFSNGVWTQFSFLRVYLYNAGNQCEALTGGWAITNHSNATSKLMATYIQISNTGTISNSLSNTHTLSKVDLSGYSKLCAQVDITELPGTNDASYIKFGLGSSLGLDGGNFTVSTKINTKPDNDTTIMSIDISSAKSNYVLFYSRYITAKITAVWFER